MVVEAHITPRVLRWARERGNLSREAVAEKIHVGPDRLEAWEAGRARPTFRQAQDLARRFAIPFGYLFLPEPPAEAPPIPDLRTVANDPRRRLSAELTALLHDVVDKQRWYREFQEEEGASPVRLVGRFPPGSSPDVIAGDIERTLGVGALRRAAGSPDDFLRLLAGRAEETGVLVMRSGIVGNNTSRRLSVDEFRGFAISDDLAPLIFINARDAKSAQVFTCLHELAHLWIGQSGISHLAVTPDAHAAEAERLCNRVAATVLMPPDDFRGRWQSAGTVADNLDRLARAYKVSRAAVLRQAYDLGFVSPERYRAATEELATTYRTVSRDSDGGNFHKTLPVRNSRRLTVALLVAMHEGRVTRRDAARRLGVQIHSLDAISASVLGLGAAG